MAALRNRGARAALGGILAFVDSDHEIDRSWIETAVEVLSEPTVAATGSRLSDPAERQLGPAAIRRAANAAARAAKRCPGSAAAISPSSAPSFERVGGFDASLTACEDVDLCNRLRLAGHRIVADPALRSIHFGDPRTLKALFFGELWRGRDNLRVTFRGPRTLRVISAVRWCRSPTWSASLAARGAMLFGHRRSSRSMFWSLALVPPGIRAAVHRATRSCGRGVRRGAQALAVAVVFDLARALALAGARQPSRTADGVTS